MGTIESLFKPRVDGKYSSRDMYQIWQTFKQYVARLQTLQYSELFAYSCYNN